MSARGGVDGMTRQHSPPSSRRCCLHSSRSTGLTSLPDLTCTAPTIQSGPSTPYSRRSQCVVTGCPIAELVRLGKIRWRIEHDYRELKHGLGLDHFEGRTFPGWHHHVTLVTAAHLFITLQRLTADPKARGAA